jgi:ClpA/ClpB-like protein
VVTSIEPWSEAIREARERQLGYVGTDLLLLALSRSDGPAGQVLRELGATPDKVLEVMDRFGWEPATDLDESRRQWPRATPAAEHARGCAHGIAIGLGKKETQVDLLLALAYERNGVHQAVLGQLGIDAAAIVTALGNRDLPVPSIPPPPRPEPHPVKLTLPMEQRAVVLRALERATIAHPDRFFDAWGGARWGVNSMPDRPGYGYIVATEDLGLRELAVAALAEAGYPPPLEDAWERRPTI